MCGVSGSCLFSSFLSVFLSGTIRGSKQYLTQNLVSKLIFQVMIEVMNKYSALDTLKGNFFFLAFMSGLTEKIFNTKVEYRHHLL